MPRTSIIDLKIALSFLVEQLEQRFGRKITVLNRNLHVENSTINFNFEIEGKNQLTAPAGISFIFLSATTTTLTYHVSCDNIELINDYIEQAYKKVCDWFNAAELTEKLHGIKLIWQVCCKTAEGANSRMSAFPRGLRFYQPQPDLFRDQYTHLTTPAEKLKVFLKEVDIVLNKLGKKLNANLSGITSFKAFEHDTNAIDYEWYKCEGAFVSLSIIDYEAIRKKLGHEPVLLHYSSLDSQEEAIQIQATKSTTAAIITELEADNKVYEEQILQEDLGEQLLSSAQPNNEWEQMLLEQQSPSTASPPRKRQKTTDDEVENPNENESSFDNELFLNTGMQEYEENAQYSLWP